MQDQITENDLQNNKGSVSTRKGRFMIETAKLEHLSASKKLKSCISTTTLNSVEFDTLVLIIAQQNTQIELLYEMIRTHIGKDRLFEKDFLAEMNKTYECISKLRNKINIRDLNK